MRRGMKQTTFGLKNSSTSKILTKASFLKNKKGLSSFLLNNPEAFVPRWFGKFFMCLYLSPHRCRLSMCLIICF